MNRGEKIAILGINGIGKSTLLKTALELISPTSGGVKWGHNTKSSYFSQDHHDLIKGNISAMNWLMQATNESNIGTIRGALAKMLLTQDQADKLVDVLSGGEAARLLFAKIMLEQGNVLVLDEPTNHLDLESRTALANSLKSFEGTIIFVSHDRHFISTVANRIIFMNKERSGDNNGVDIVVPQNVAIICCAVWDIIFFEFFGEDPFINVCEPKDVRSFCIEKSVEMDTGNHTRAYYTYIRFVFHFAFLMAVKR